MHYTGKQQGHAARCFCPLDTMLLEIGEDVLFLGLFTQTI